MHRCSYLEINLEMMEILFLSFKYVESFHLDVICLKRKQEKCSFTLAEGTHFLHLGD